MNQTDKPINVFKDMISVANTAVIDNVLNLHADLVEMTPVDTGWASNNWQITVSKPAKGTLGQRPSTGEAFEEQADTTAILTYDVSQGPVYITNNVRYIQALNAKHKKAKGFVEIAVRKMQRRFEVIQKMEALKRKIGR